MMKIFYADEWLQWLIIIAGMVAFIFFVRGNVQDWKNKFDAWHYGEARTVTVQQKSCPQVEQEICDYKVTPM